MPENIDVFAVYIHMLAIMALCMKICCTTTCAGVSGKTQFLFAVAFTAKYVPDWETDIFFDGNHTPIKVIYLVIIYCTVASIFIFFRKTYERKYDTFRISPLLFGCLLSAVLLNFHRVISGILMTFGVYVESIALLAQTHFVVKADCAHYHIFYYVSALAAYDFLYLVYLVGTAPIRLLDNGLHQIVAAGCLVQLVVCGHFLWMARKRLRPEVLEEDASQDAEAGGLGHTCSKGSREKCNICSVVMTAPEIMMVTSDDDKVKLLDAEETN